MGNYLFPNTTSTKVSVVLNVSVKNLDIQMMAERFEDVKCYWDVYPCAIYVLRESVGHVQEMNVPFIPAWV